MPKILLDVFLMTLSVPNERPDAEVAAARRILDRKSFQKKLLKAAQAVFREHPELASVALTLSR